MRRIALLLAGILASHPALAQERRTVTLVIAPGPQRQIENLDSISLAQQVRQMLDRGALSGTSIPLILDGRRHEKRIRLGGDPAVFVDGGLNRTIVQGVQRDIVLSYGPARRGGLGVHAEMVDSTVMPDGSGNVSRNEGRRTEITGIVPTDGNAQAIINSPQPEPGSVVLPTTLIVLVEP